jgi:predicted regulator of Ras-like GTPase activity (Roadblock/LC7/MglB family)
LFESIFDDIRERIDSIISIGVWGIDGLELENHIVNDSNIDYELYGAEVADVLKATYAIKDKLDAVLIKINYKKKILVLLPVNEEFFYMVFADENVLLSKLEFYLKLYKDDVLNKIS